MRLTKEQQAVLDGAKGEVQAKVMKTLVMYGECFGADTMAPVSGGYGHLVTSFGLSMMKPVFSLMDQLIEAGALSARPFTADPRPLDKNVPSGMLQDILFKIMYSKQAPYEQQLQKLGLLSKDGFSCTCYMEEVGNIPKEGDVLSWAESSAVVYANSVLGARCNRNSGIIELFGGIAGCVPLFGLLTDAGREAGWVVEVSCKEKPEAQVLGSAIGMKVMENVPYIRGLSGWLGGSLGQSAKDYLKDMGAAAASNGAVGLYHVEGITPEAAARGESLVCPGAQVYRIDDAELKRVKDAYPVMWKDVSARPKLCFVGCPHLSLEQLAEWAQALKTALSKNGRTRLAVPCVFTAAPAVCKTFAGTPAARQMADCGAVISSICPLMYMNNPLCGKTPVITNSNKLRTYTSARYYTDAEILKIVTGEGAQ